MGPGVGLLSFSFREVNETIRDNTNAENNVKHVDMLKILQTPGEFPVHLTPAQTRPRALTRTRVSGEGSCSITLSKPRGPTCPCLCRAPADTGAGGEGVSAASPCWAGGGEAAGLLPPALPHQDLLAATALPLSGSQT